MQNESSALHSKEALGAALRRGSGGDAQSIERGITTEGVLPGKLRNRAAALRRVLVVRC